jgi:hypothetical protein
MAHLNPIATAGLRVDSEGSLIVNRYGVVVAKVGGDETFVPPRWPT